MSMERNSFISELVRQRKNIQIVFFSDYDLKNILITTCAFLNSEGGWIVVGHTGDNVTGISGNPNNLVGELRTNIANSIMPQSLVYIQLEEYTNKSLLLINVLKGTRSPYSFEKQYYIRKGHQSIVADNDEISILLRRPNELNSTWEKLTVIDASINDLDQNEVLKTIDLADKFGRSKALPKSIENFLNYFQLFEYDSIKNGAVILYGKEPLRFLPQSRIRITVMPYGKTGSKYEDTLTIEDNLFGAFEKISSYFRNQLPVVSEFKYNSWHRVDRIRYPLEALDEAVVNAMVHRDYGDVSGEVIIDIFPDRIEITNSGEIPYGILKDKSHFEVYHPVFRNPMLAHMFFLRGMMEKKGRGLSLIRESFLDYGLKSPEWIAINGFTTLRLYGVPESIELNKRMSSFILTLKIGANVSREQYETFFNGKISEKTARLDISKLVEGGWLSKISDGPTTSYVRTNKELPDITR